jgi:hypothetical protein
MEIMLNASWAAGTYHRCLQGSLQVDAESVLAAIEASAGQNPGLVAEGWCQCCLVVVSSLDLHKASGICWRASCGGKSGVITEFRRPAR